MADIGIKIRASDETKSAFDSVGRSLGTIQTSAASVAGALASIGVGVSIGGFVAMTKQIVDGLDAMNDLKDATGASIENISALEDVALRTGASFDTVSTALIKLNQGLNSAKPGSDTEAAINAIGLSVKDLKDLDPAEAFRQIAVGLSGFADDANKARITQELFGKSLKEVAPLLKDVAEAGELVGTVTTEQAEQAEVLNKQLFNLQANALRAGRAFATELLPTLTVLAAEFTKADQAGGSLSSTLGNSMKTALEAAVRVGAGAAFVFTNIAREVGGVVAGLDALGNGGGIFSKEGRAAWGAVWDARKEDFERAVNEYNDLMSRVSGAGAPSAPTVGAAAKPSIGNLPDQAAAKAAAAATAKAIADQNRELEKQAKLIAEGGGLVGSFAEDWNRLTKIFEKGGLNLDQLTEAQAKLLAGQPGIKAAHDAEAKAASATEKANQAALDARQKYNDYLGQGLASVEAENQTIQDQIDRLGLNKAAIAELDAQRLESQAITQDLIVLKKMEQGVDEDQYEIYVKTAAELRKQAALKRTLAVKETTLEAGKETANATFEEWKRGWEETDRLGRQVWTDMTTQGQNAAEKIGKAFRTTVSSALYDVFAKPYLLQLYTSIAGNGGAAGAVQAASGALSGGSNPLSGITSALTGSFGLGMQGTIATIAEQGFIGGFSNAMTSAKTLASAGDFLGAAGSALPYAGAAIAGLAAIKALTDYKIEATGNALVANLGGGSTVVANRNDYKQTSSGFLSGGNTNNSEWSAASAELTAYMDAQVKLVTESARAYGTALGLPVADLDSFKQQIEVSLTGLNADQAKEAINKAIGGFGDALVSANFGPALDGLKRSGETSSATLVRVASQLTTVNGTLGMLGGKLLSVDAAGIRAADGLVQAMGGLEAFQQQTASYYQNFYTAEEQRLQKAQQIQSQLSQAGIDVPMTQILNVTKEQFRAFVDSFVNSGGLLTEAGQKAIAALMGVQGMVAEIANSNVQTQTASSGYTGSGGGGGGGSAGGYTGPTEGGFQAIATGMSMMGMQMAWQEAQFFTLAKFNEYVATLESGSEFANVAESSVGELVKSILTSYGGMDGGAEAANAILQERKTLQDELDNLTMTSTELLEKQRNALDESNRELWDQVQAAKEAARVAEQNKSLQDEYNQLTMTSAQLRALEREEIAEANLELFDRITALKAEQEAITTANNAVDAALAGVQRAIDAEKQSIEAARQAAQERVGILKSIVDSIGSAVDSLRGNVDSTKSQAARQANAFIDNALATAQASGYMPDADDLKDAISKATAGINREGLSQFEYEKQQLILAGKLEALGAIAEPQLSAAEEAVKVAETQLQVLDDIMEEARKQVDELRGIDTSVKSVEAAIAALTAAILASITAQGTSYRPTPNTPLPNVGGIKQQGLTYAEMQAHAVNLSNWNANPIDAGTALYNAAVRYGYTSDDLDRAMGWTAGHSLEWALANGLPAFDVGTNMVPHDMVAQIHEGEAIIPKAYNPAAGGVSGNARLESLVEGLTKEVQRLQAIVNDGNKSNERIAVAVNGNPDRPVPIDVLENSAGLATA